MKDEKEYYEIEGLYETTQKWHPLFQYTSEYQASQILTHLLGLESLPPELEAYEDFRCVTVLRETPEDRKRAARAEKGASSAPSEAPVSPSEPRKRSEARAAAAQGRSKAQKGQKRESKKARSNV